MPACPYRSWSANDSNCKPKSDSVSTKEIDEKLKKLMADRNALDQRLITPIQKTDQNSLKSTK
jgi:hypothetical protein